MDPNQDRARRMLGLLNSLRDRPDIEDVPEAMAVAVQALWDAVDAMTPGDLVDLAEAMAAGTYPDTLPEPVLADPAIVAAFNQRSADITSGRIVIGPSPVRPTPPNRQVQ